jgi:hypothetical protein
MMTWHMRPNNDGHQQRCFDLANVKALRSGAPVGRPLTPDIERFLLKFV